MQVTSGRPKLRMRACPRCGGDLYRDMLEVDEEFVCLQCGRRAESRPPSQSDSVRTLRRVA